METNKPDISKFDILIKDEGNYIVITFQSEKAIKALKKRQDMKRNTETDDVTGTIRLTLDKGYLYPMRSFCKRNYLKLFEF